MSTIAKNAIPLFDVCPQNIGEYERQDYHTEVKWNDPAVLLELMEYRVVLPIIGYKRQAIVFSIEFNNDRFVVKKVAKLLNREFSHEELRFFPMTKIEEAIQYLIEEVSQTTSKKS